MLKGFATNGRDLTDKETQAFLKAADKDGDGKIGVEGKTWREIKTTPRCSAVFPLKPPVK